MIDYGEEKQIYGVPKIGVGPVTQTMTAIYILTFILAFFMPEQIKAVLPQINTALPGKFWTLLTGALVFPESFIEFSRTPAGFWVIVSFFLNFLVLRVLERGIKKWYLTAGFVLIFILLPGLVLWASAPHSDAVQDSWSFWFAAAAAAAVLDRREFKVKLFFREIRESYLYALIPLTAIAVSLFSGNPVRAVIYAGCALAGAALWRSLKNIASK